MASITVHCTSLLGGRSWEGGTALSPNCNSFATALAANFHRSGGLEKTFRGGVIKRGAAAREPVAIASGSYAPVTVAEAREPTGRGRLNFWYPDKPKHKLVLTGRTARRRSARRAASRQQYNVPQQSETVPLWLWVCLALYRAVQDALQFLWEQPGQVKDIEWPSFQSTIKMAMLTVVVVTLLIIFLATIDSTFSYVLSSILRRVP